MSARTYAYAVVALALAAIFLDVPTVQPVDWGVLALFASLLLVAEWAALTTPFGGTVSVSFALLYAALLLGGPLTAMLAAALTTTTPQDIRQHKPPHRILFNIAQYVLASLMAGVVLQIAKVPPLSSHRAYALDISAWLAPALFAAVVLAAVNWLLVGLAISLSQGLRLRDVWASEFRLHLLSFGALTLLGLVLVQVVVIAGPLAVLLLAVPFFVAHQTFSVYRELAVAFTATIRALAQLLEVKDPYTRGHSERVAIYARELGEGLGLGGPFIHQVELAALLHDIGKVGVSAATLVKPGTLSAEEYDGIKVHPVAAASILADIEFLGDAVPYIEAHHERLDGTGYPYGLRGNEIPLGARILAVADAFDAMTSDRAYRAGLTYETARQELLDDAGRRLDADCVEALLARVDERRMHDVVTMKEGAWDALSQGAS